MPIWWIDHIAGAGANNGTSFATPKQWFSELTALAPGDEVRIKSNAALVDCGMATLTNNSVTVAFADASQIQVGDVITIDSFTKPGILVQTVAGNNVTMYVSWPGATGSYRMYRIRPSVITQTLAQSRISASGSPNLPIRFSWGWDTESTRNGWCAFTPTVSAYYIDSSGTTRMYLELDGCGRTVLTASATVTTAAIAASARNKISGFHIANTSAIVLTAVPEGIEVSNNFFSCPGTGYAIYYTAGISDGCIVSNNVIYKGSNAFHFPLSNSIVKGNTIAKIGSGSSVLNFTGARKVKYMPDNQITSAGTVGGFVNFNGFNTRGSCILDTVVIPSGVTNMLVNTPAIATKFSRCRCKNYNAVVGDHRTFVERMGTLIRNTGDSQIGMPNGITDVLEIRSDIVNGEWQLATRPSSISGQYLPTICEDAIMFLVPRASTMRFRFLVNTQIDQLSQNQLYIEIVRQDNSTVQSSNSPLVVAANKNDWSQSISTPDMTFAAGETFTLNVFVNWYDVAKWVYLAPLEYSTDSGNNWALCDYGWLDGERIFRLPAILGLIIPSAGDVVSSSSQYGYPESLITPTRVEPPEAKVENGYQYGNPSSLRTGTLVCEQPALPDPGEVWSGAGNYGYVATPITPTRIDPAQSNVVSGIQYGDPGNPKTGTYIPPEATLPAAGNVWNGSGQYGYPGSLINPTRTDANQSDVKAGVKYGDPNNQKTGTLNVAGSSPVADPTAQRREAIIDNIKSTLAGIIAIGEPVANGNNSNPADSLVVSTLGDYTYTNKTIYQVEITTGGASGVAKCTITDTGDGSDSVVGEQIITSGSAINLGTRGGQIKFTFATGETLTIGDKWTITCDVYNRTIKRVYRARANGVEINEYPSIVISEASQQYLSPGSKRYTNVMEVECEQWVEERDGENIGQIMNEALQDMELALSSDPTRGGYAEDTVFVRNDLGIPIEGRPFGVVSLTIQIRYHQVI